LTPKEGWLQSLAKTARLRGDARYHVGRLARMPIETMDSLFMRSHKDIAVLQPKDPAAPEVGHFCAAAVSRARGAPSASRRLVAGPVRRQKLGRGSR
jgi:hypothetical protein